MCQCGRRDPFLTCSDSASLLVGRSIVYKFEEQDGGWAFGTITEPLTDETHTEEVTEGGLSGSVPLNFKVFYAADEETVEHLLTCDQYASSVTATPGSWCLLDGTAPRRGRSGKAAAAAPQDAGMRKGKGKQKLDISKLSKAQRKALLEELVACDSD